MGMKNSGFFEISILRYLAAFDMFSGLLVILTWLKCSSAELLSAIRLETEAGRLPSNLASGMEELYQNYKNAVNFYS